jgi:hypothetical protein
LLSHSSVSTDLKLMVLVFVKSVASVQSLFVALRVDSNINELSCKVASYSALSIVLVPESLISLPVSFCTCQE